MLGEPSINFVDLYSYNFYLNLLFKIHIYKILYYLLKCYIIFKFYYTAFQIF